MTATIDLNNIPAELVALPQWVMWKYEARDGKQTKVCYQPTGQHAKSNDPSTWSSLQACSTALTHFDGIGIMFANGLVGIDLDHHIGDDGSLSDLAREIVASLKTYWEISPSGHGLHAFGFGELPPGRRKSTRHGIEMYSMGRYFTVTGKHLDGTPMAVNRLNGELADLHRRVFGGAKPEAPPRLMRAAQPVNLNDHELIERAKSASNGAAFNRLWHGDISGHPSQSEADLALCDMLAFWTGREAVQMDRLFRQSGLMRGKWNERHSSDGQTYGQMTIDKAAAGTREVYMPPKDTDDLMPDLGPDVPMLPDAPAVSFMRTDAGNGQRLAHRHGETLKYHESVGWLHWNGKRWERDTTGEIMRRARETARSIFNEAKSATTDEAASAIGKWAAASQSNGRLEAMIHQAQSELAVIITPDQLDRDVMRLNVGNGALDLRTGKLHPHDPSDMLTRITMVDYDPDATCPLWLKVLDRVMAGNRRMTDFLQRVAGYMLTGDTSEQCLFFLHGTGKNGKTVFTSTLQSMLGEYAVRTPTETLIAKHGDSSIPNDVARLPGARIVIAAELPEGKRFNEPLIKDLTGQDVVVARFLHREFFEFRPQFKLLIFGNHKPDIRGTDEGIWRRVRKIPFDVIIPETERDSRLIEKLHDELPGILAWAVRGCLEWQRVGLGTPDEVKRATDDYRAEMDTLGSFIAECCVILPDARVGSKALYAAYTKHAEMSGETAETSTQFRQRMIERGFSPPKHTETGTTWAGLGLSEASSADEN